MSELPIPVGFYSKLAAVLASIVSVGFLSWAAVVWNASQDIKTDLNAVLVGQKEATLRVEYITRELTRHQGRPWHDEAGTAHAQTRREMDAMRHRLENLEKNVP